MHRVDRWPDGVLGDDSRGRDPANLVASILGKPERSIRRGDDTIDVGRGRRDGVLTNRQLNLRKSDASAHNEGRATFPKPWH